jgi:hypothetical protein
MLSALFASLASTDVFAALLSYATNTWTWGG